MHKMALLLCNLFICLLWRCHGRFVQTSTLEFDSSLDVERHLFRQESKSTGPKEHLHSEGTLNPSKAFVAFLRANPAVAFDTSGLHCHRGSHGRLGSGQNGRSCSRHRLPVMSTSSELSQSDTASQTASLAQEDDQAQASQPQDISALLDKEKVTDLFAWVSRAWDGDERFSDLGEAFDAIFFDPPVGSRLARLLSEAKAAAPSEEELVGESLLLAQREINSLGAMGAGQWAGSYITRPHALLDVRPFTSVEDWVQSLGKGCRKTIKRAAKQNFTVTTKVMEDGLPAPHSSLAHFRCVVEHEVRLLASSPEDLFGALRQAIFRYMGSTTQTGEIQEYRDQEGQIIAFAHTICKGRVNRGQWFYATNAASKRFVWFHSVQELVRRSIQMDGVEFADLGPSGSDSFSELKERYKFISIDNWNQVADYSGAFRYGDKVPSSMSNIKQVVLERILLGGLPVGLLRFILAFTVFNLALQVFAFAMKIK